MTTFHWGCLAYSSHYMTLQHSHTVDRFLDSYIIKPAEDSGQRLSWVECSVISAINFKQQRVKGKQSDLRLPMLRADAGKSSFVSSRKLT